MINLIFTLFLAAIGPTEMPESTDRPYFKFNGDIVQVALAEEDLKGGVGDKVLLYKLVPKLEHPEFAANDDEWMKFAVVKLRSGTRFYPLGIVPRGRIPVYHPDLTTLIFDPALGEETLVAIFKPGVSDKVKHEWAWSAVSYLRGYRANLLERK